MGVPVHTKLAKPFEFTFHVPVPSVDEPLELSLPCDPTNTLSIRVQRASAHFISILSSQPVFIDTSVTPEGGQGCIDNILTRVPIDPICATFVIRCLTPTWVRNVMAERRHR